MVAMIPRGTNISEHNLNCILDSQKEQIDVYFQGISEINRLLTSYEIGNIIYYIDRYILYFKAYEPMALKLNDLNRPLTAQKLKYILRHLDDRRQHYIRMYNSAINFERNIMQININAYKENNEIMKRIIEMNRNSMYKNLSMWHEVLRR
jgi:hypothetical protein